MDFIFVSLIVLLNVGSFKTGLKAGQEYQKAISKKGKDKASLTKAIGKSLNLKGVKTSTFINH